MQNITLCKGWGCELKEHCHRWDQNTPCTPDCIGQSYFWQIPYKDGDCEYFDPMSNYAREKGDAK